jgi:hypothetical protein
MRARSVAKMILWQVIGIALLLPRAMAAEGVSIDLEAGDDFTVGDDQVNDVLTVDGRGALVEGSSHLESLLPGFGGTAEDGEVALALTTGVFDGDVTYPMAIIRKELARATTWFSVGGAYITSAFVRVDGSVRATYDPVTRKLSITQAGGLVDPDGPGGLASMGQFGADVEHVLILKSSNTPPINGRPRPKLILGIDKEEDWVWQVENDGRQCWGSPVQKGYQSWDVCLQRVDAGGFEHPRFTLDYDGDPVDVDIKAPVVQGTGSASHGPLLWGDGSDAFDTGAELCQSQSLDCQTSFTTAGVQQSCATDHGDAGTYFYAMCR